MDIVMLQSVIKVGDVFQNPQKGTSTISSITDGYITYIRGSSPLRLPVSVLFSVINDFSGKKCSSTDLRKYLPEVFDSHNPNGRKGHSCNCTFLFRVVERMGLIENGIQGGGTSGNPFYIVFK